MFKWRKEFSISDCILDSEWKSPKGEFKIRPYGKRSESNPFDEIGIRGQCDVNYPSSDNGYQEALRRQIEDVFSCYSMLFRECKEISYISSYELLNEDELKLKGIECTHTADPITLRLKSRFESSKFDEAWALFKKISVDQYSDSYKTCIRWFNRGLISDEIEDSFISFWISFNILYATHNIINGNSYSTDIGKMDALIDKLKVKSCKELLKSYKNSIKYIRKNYLNKFCSNNGTIDYVWELDDKIKNRKYKESVKELTHIIYVIRKYVFHEGKIFNNIDKESMKKITPILANVVQLCFNNLIN